MSPRARLVAVSIVAAALAACQPEGLIHHYAGAAADTDDDEVADALVFDQLWSHDDGGYLVSPPVDAAAGATRASALVVLADEATMPTIQARGLIGGEPATEWTTLGAAFDEVTHHVAFADLPITVDAVQLRILESDIPALAQLSWSATVPETEIDAQDVGDVAGSAAPLIASLSGLGIVTRAEWGARSTSCGPADTHKYRITIHHTETGTTDTARQLRSIQAYHISKGWCDIGYHFLIGVDGRVYEGRPIDIKGVHTLNNNTGNIGIAFVGSYGASLPSPAMMDSAGRLLGTLSHLYGIDLNRTNVKGHRELRETDCPGDALYGRISSLIATGQVSDLGGSTPPPTMPPPTMPPPASGGASCTHSLGGAYASTACSASYQCCDGSWRLRSSGCGTCACVEETGRTGCTTTTTTPPPTMPPPTGTGLPYGGLTQSGSEIPRAGLANGTLRASLGVATEPYGTTVTDSSGRSWVSGTVSWFGGPNDTGVTTTETGAVSGERLRSLNSPLSPSASQLAANPGAYYFVAMRWNYSPNGTSWWRNARILIENPANGVHIVARPVDWGPNTSTHRIIDLSPETIAELGLDTNGTARVSFAPAGTPLGRVH